MYPLHEDVTPEKVYVARRRRIELYKKTTSIERAVSGIPKEKKKKEKKISWYLTHI